MYTSCFTTCANCSLIILINPFSHYFAIYEDGVCILHLLNVTKEDNAIFSCNAINTFGSTKTESRIIIECN